MEQIWNWAIPYLGGITIGAIVICLGVLIFKAVANRVINNALDKIDGKKTEEKAVKAGIEKLKAINFTHDIAPIAKSELEKIYEYAIKYLDDGLNKMGEKWDLLVNVIEKFSAYFENSIGVSEEKKAALHDAILKAKGEKLMQDPETAVLEIEEKTETTPKKTINKAVER